MLAALPANGGVVMVTFVSRFVAGEFWVRGGKVGATVIEVADHIDHVKAVGPRRPPRRLEPHRRTPVPTPPVPPCAQRASTTSASAAITTAATCWRAGSRTSQGTRT